MPRTSTPLVPLLARLTLAVAASAAVAAARPAAAQMPPALVQVEPVEQRPVKLTQPLVASVEPVTRTTLAAEQAGLVESRTFDEGDYVRPPDASAAAAGAAGAARAGAAPAAAAGSAEALVRLKTDLVDRELAAARAAHSAAEAMVKHAEAEASRAARELERLTELRRDDIATEKEVQDALQADRVAAALVTARRADVDKAAAEVARLELVRAKSAIYSPLAGVVSKRYVEVGEWIKQGDPVADLVQLDPLFVRINVPEEWIASVRKGQEAEVTIDALGGRKVVGRVEQILPEADPASRTFAVKLLVPNPGLEIRPGFFARAALRQTRDVEGGVLVPRDAIVAKGEAAHVVVARDAQGAGAVAAIVPVKRGPAEGDKLIVFGDLKPGDLVVTRGNEALMPGQSLIIPPGRPPAATTPATRPSAERR